MFITHATKDQIYQAFGRLNEKNFDGNIRFYSEYNRGEPEPYRNGFNVRFKVHTVEKRGHRWHPKLFKMNDPNSNFFDYEKGAGHRSAYACWHVYGYFFEHLFEIEPDAVVRSQNRKITAHYGNWEDYNIGSQRYPYYASDACFCGIFDELERVRQTPEKELAALIDSLCYTRCIIEAIKKLPQEEVPLMLGKFNKEAVSKAIEKRLRKG